MTNRKFLTTLTASFSIVSRGLGFSLRSPAAQNTCFDEHLSSSARFDELLMNANNQHSAALDELPTLLTSSNFNNHLQPRPVEDGRLSVLGPYSVACLNEPSLQEMLSYQDHLTSWTARYSTGELLPAKVTLKLAATAMPFIQAISPSYRSKNDIYVQMDLMVWAILFDDYLTKAMEASNTDNNIDSKEVKQILDLAIQSLRAGLNGEEALDEGAPTSPIESFATMTHFIGKTLHNIAASNGRLSDNQQDRMVQAIERVFNGLQRSFVDGSPSTAKEQLERHAGWEEDSSYVILFAELADILDELLLCNNTNDAINATMTTDEKLRLFALQTSKCIVLSNEAMAAKDMGKDADESYVALRIHEMLTSQGLSISLANSKKYDPEWCEFCKLLDMRKIENHSKVLNRFLPTELGFDVMQGLNLELREAFTDLIKMAKEYDGPAFHVLNRLRWGFGHHMMVSTLQRYGKAFDVYKSAALDDNFDTYLEKMKKFEV